MTLEKSRPPSVTPAPAMSVEVARQLSEQILSGALRPGDRLPTEQEMMAAMGVSRTVVREALAALKAEGLVMTRQGIGAFVMPSGDHGPFRINPDGLTSIDEVLKIFDLRLGIEIEMAGLAAAHRKQPHLRKLAACLDAIDRAIDQGGAAIEADFAFHCAIAEATGNEHFLRFLRFLGTFIIPRQSVRVNTISEAEQVVYLRRIQNEHQAILAAIESRDTAAARDAARFHLTNGRERYRQLAKGADLGSAPARQGRHRA